MPTMAQALEDMNRELVSLRAELVDANRRMANMIRVGSCSEVDPETGTHRIIYADENGQPVPSPKIPWTQRAGSQKEWNPPAVGEQMIMISPSGEIGDGSWGMFGGWTDQFAQNHNKSAEYKFTLGNFTIFAKDGQAVISVGDTSLTLTPGKAVLKSAEIVTDGVTHVGGEGGLPASREGTVTSDGAADVGNFATKVFLV